MLDQVELGTHHTLPSGPYYCSLLCYLLGITTAPTAHRAALTLTAQEDQQPLSFPIISGARSLFCACNWAPISLGTSVNASKYNCKSLDIPALHALAPQEPTEGWGSCTKLRMDFSYRPMNISWKYTWESPNVSRMAVSEKLVSLTFERRLILSSLSSRTRKLGGTYQKQTFVCWGYIDENKIHTQHKLAILKIPRTFLTYLFCNF